MSAPGSLLIVEHGPGRGRPLRTLDLLLKELRRNERDLYAAVRRHSTGSDALPDLEGVRSVVFWLGDPLRELYPECHAEAVAITARARGRGLRLVNPPESLSNTIKSVQARLWREAGLPTPRHVPFADREGLEAALAVATLPVLIKADRLHVQKSMRVLETLEEARAFADQKAVFPGSLADLVDTRLGFRASEPGSVWARYYHKKRVLVLGDAVSPRTCLFATQPIVGLKQCTYAPYLARRAFPRLAVDRWARRCIRAEQAWWEGGVEEPELLRRAAHVLGLELAAIDYSTRSDGSIVLWEANPYFWLPPSGGPKALRRQRGFTQRWQRTCRDFAGFVETLIHAEPAGPGREDGTASAPGASHR